MLKKASTWIIIVNLFVMLLPLKLLQFLVIDLNHRSIQDIYTAWTSIFIHANWLQMIINMAYLILFLFLLSRLQITLTSLEFLIWYVIPPTIFNLVVLYSHFGDNHGLFMGASNSVMVIGGITFGYQVYQMIVNRDFSMVNIVLVGLLSIMILYYIVPGLHTSVITTTAHIYGFGCGLIGFVILHYNHTRISKQTSKS